MRHPTHAHMTAFGMIGLATMLIAAVLLLTGCESMRDDGVSGFWRGLERQSGGFAP